MATTKSLNALITRRLSPTPLLTTFNSRIFPFTSSAAFSVSTFRAATPAGPPPAGFRLPPRQRWDQGESSLDKAGKYFLLAEIFRGMYVVLEQFFRPPYVRI